MFDGDFRSRRREVNLSGSNRRAGGKTKRDLLKNAEAQRKQRQERVRRDKAAKLIQRATRGHLSRLRTVRGCALDVLALSSSLSSSSSLPSPSACPANLDGNSNSNRQRPVMAALSMCLSHRSLLKQFDTTRRDLLLGFHRGGCRSNTIAGNNESNNNNNNNNSSNNNNNKCAADGDPQPMEMDSDDDSGLWFSQKRIVAHAIEEFDPSYQGVDSGNGDGDSGSNRELYRLLNAYRDSTRIDDEVFLGLTNCMQRWYLCGAEGSENAKAYQTMLRRWATEASDRLANPHSGALLATILLGNADGTVAGDNNSSSSTPMTDAPNTDQTEQWFDLLVDILARSEGNAGSTENTTNGGRGGGGRGRGRGGNKTGEDLLIRATMENLCNRQVQRLLSNLLDLTKSPKLVLLINHVLRQPQNNKLKLAVSLLARGDSLLEKKQQQQQQQSPHISNKNDWDDADDSDVEEEDPDQKPSSHKKARGGSSTYYKRQEILTMAKLDKVYCERIQQSAKEHHHRALDASTIDVATKIIRAPWKDWGLSLLVGVNSQSVSKKTPEVERFVEVLGYLLQASSSLRPKARFTPLSPLAFNQTILCSLWNHVRERTGDCGLVLSIFSDLFSHYLVALSDEDFIKYHCTSTSSGSGSDRTADAEHRILARDVVARYNKELHELYWTKPVVVNEIQMDSARGRLMLSGTKLWNALHERWNRLVSVSFCEESAWWFPHMGSNEGDRAVISDREVGHTMHDDDDDDDDDDDSMGVDENQPQLSTAEAASDALADSFRDPKMARVLTSIPQALPFDRRVKLFHSLLKADKQKVVQAAQSRTAVTSMTNGWDQDTTLILLDGSVREQITIQRAALYENSMEQLNKLGTNLKHKVQVTFVNKHGAQEPGIDGGGVFKEFLDDLIKDGFAAKSDNQNEGGAPQLFSITPKQQQLTMNLDLTEDKSMLEHYEFLGRVLGKAVYESILVEPQFCLPFLNQLLGKVNTLEDLKNYDEEYYNNLNKLRHYTEDEMDGLALSFELTVGGNSNSSTRRTVELVRSGRSIAVTKNNVFQYSQAVANELLNVLGANQTRAFLKGFRDLIKVAWIRLFSARELQKLISGDDSVRGIDVASLKKAIHYLGGYHESQPYIQDFWDILENELSPEQQRKFLRFMTSCSRQPLLGFSSLEPFPAIQQIRLQDDERSKNSRLPTSSTCMNLLKLPNYQDRALLKEKLIAAVESGAGFELT